MKTTLLAELGETREFPKLMINSEGTVVLLWYRNAGVVIKGNSNGEDISGVFDVFNFDLDGFVPFEGTITLIQD